jgi:hypothetical protein
MEIINAIEQDALLPLLLMMKAMSHLIRMPLAVLSLLCKVLIIVINIYQLSKIMESRLIVICFVFSILYSKIIHTFTEDFIDIIGHETDKVTKMISFKFQYDSFPYFRLVQEKDAPLDVISEYYKRTNLLDKSLVGPVIENCLVNKDLPCYNKTKTKGI